ncbi:universal stress protein [Flavobacterium agrisoli]|uniref:Universal stress protein n=1 Tax=Flavobacterium agrisoli TaxID=2793066 RepID=A0A934PLI8_9FLAO|nr:universal stress protein [Flavobacterium agrisoli]MBK0368706.1 universal stress protein [Flavobacterium agrisoli]
MKKILFPTDFSETSQNAFVHALEFANFINAELLLLHSFELPVFDSQFFPENYATIYDSIELAQFEMFKDEVPKLRSIAQERKLENIRIQHRLMDGDLIFNLKRAIDEEKADFIVMGTSGLSDWSTFFLGSNTEAIISSVHIPVLCIPSEVPYKKVKNIGFTTRYREKDKAELKKTIAIAKKMNAQVKCLYVKSQNSDVSEATIKEWETEFMGEPVVFSVLPSDDIKETVLDFILFKEIDVLAVIAYKRTFFEAILNPSFSKKIVKEVQIPVLIMHEH